MRDFFKGVSRHIGKLDAPRLREQYQRLSEETLFLDTLVATITQGIIVLDEEGKVVKSNPAAAELLGMRPDDAIGALGAPLGRASKREIDITYPEDRTLQVRTVPMGRLTLVHLDDITAEKRRTAEELRAGASRAVRDLAAGVAHEIGNPLNALALNLQLLRRSSSETAEVDECLRQVDRLNSILQGFLQALRPSKPNLAPGTIADPVRRCLAAMRHLFEERGVKVSVDLPGSLPPVALDGAQMEQVFFNLLKNALEAVHDGGAIEISFTDDDNDVIVRIADNGEGMSAETVARLFEPYRTTKAHGTGLGLMISSRIVRDHGGDIGVESNPGAGTVFTIRLPRLERRIRALK